MNLYFLRQTYREICNNKSFFAINVLGLSVGIVVFLIIAVWIHTELSYDKFHRDAGRIYRVDYLLYEEGELEQHSAAAVPVIGSMLVNTYPEVEMYTRFRKSQAVVRYNEIFFKENNILYAQSSFFELFNFPIIEGDNTSGVLGINKAVITKSVAQRYFGQQSPIGEVLILNESEKFEITAVVDNPPVTSHIQFDILISFETLISQVPYFDIGWFVPEFYTYIRLAPGANAKEVEAQFPALVQTHLGNFMKEADFLKEFKLRPLQDIHLHSSIDNEITTNGSMLRVQALGLVSLIILLVAFTNYIILNTSRSADRAYKVALCKAMGARKKQLIGWLLTETTVIMVVAMIISLLAIYYMNPFLENILKSPVIFSVPFMVTLLILIMATGLLFTGIIPALGVLQVPSSAIRQGKQMIRSKKGALVRNGLILFQFTASIALIAATIILSRQMDHLMQQNLGFNPDQIIIVEAPGARGESYPIKSEAFRREMLKLPQLNQMASSSNVPGEEIHTKPVYGRAPLAGEPELHSSNLGKIIPMILVDAWYLETYELKLIAGKNFTHNYFPDPHEVILNESALPYLGFSSAEEAVGSRLTSSQGNALVIGVIKDFNQRSLHHTLSPLIMAHQPSTSYFSISFTSNGVQEVLSELEKQWNAFFPGNPLIYSFLNTTFYKEHVTDKNFGQLLTIFTLLAIFISCLGLVGISSYNTSIRTKEIGIRKANGAKLPDIMLLLNIGLVKWVLIAFLVATPIAWFAMNRWLQNFAYRTELSWWIFPVAGAIALTIALVTVSWQSWQAAKKNPVESLRYE